MKAILLLTLLAAGQSMGYVTRFTPPPDPSTPPVVEVYFHRDFGCAKKYVISHPRQASLTSCLETVAKGKGYPFCKNCAGRE